MKVTEIPGKIDWLIFFIATALLLFSVPFVYSASAYVASQKFGSSEGIVMNQILRVGLSLAFIILFTRIDYHRYKHYAKLLYILGIGALVIVLFVGAKTKGAVRWIDSLFQLSCSPCFLLGMYDCNTSSQFSVLPFRFWVYMVYQQNIG